MCFKAEYVNFVFSYTWTQNQWSLPILNKHASEKLNFSNSFLKIKYILLKVEIKIKLNYKIKSYKQSHNLRLKIMPFCSV